MAAPWVMLGRVLAVAFAPATGHGNAEAQPGPDFHMAVVLPPGVTVVTAAPNAQSNPTKPDMYPYILAADRSHLLFNFSLFPFHGVDFSLYPLFSNLIVKRQFQDPAPGAGLAAAPAERIPARGIDQPAIRSLQSIGIVAHDIDIDQYVVAELMVDRRNPRARLVYVCTDDTAWRQEDMDYPLHAADRDWSPAGVVSHDQKLWWFDLSWGILTCDPLFDENMELLFHALPEGRALDMACASIVDYRCITESSHDLRYAEIIREGGAARLSMWTRIPVVPMDGDGIIAWEWIIAYEMNFAEIWNDDSYARTGLPARVPVLTLVCPSNPDLVYFSLNQCLFGVNVPLHRVVDFIEDHGLVMPRRPASWRYVLAWLLPPQVVTALGIDPFDNGHQEPPGALESGDDAGTESGDDTARVRRHCNRGFHSTGTRQTARVRT